MTNNRKAIEQQIESLLSRLANPDMTSGMTVRQISDLAIVKQIMVLRAEIDSEGETYSLKELGETFGMSIEQVREVIMMGQVWRTQATERAKAAE